MSILDESGGEEPLFYGITYQQAGIPELARPHFEALRTELEQELQGHPGDPDLLAELGATLGYLGETDSAIAMISQAIERSRVVDDALTAPANHRTIIYALIAAGEHDRAIEELEAYLAGPGRWTIEGLVVDVGLAPIRDDPRVLELLARHRRDWN